MEASVNTEIVDYLVALLLVALLQAAQNYW